MNIKERAVKAAKAVKQSLTRPVAWNDVRVPDDIAGILLIWNPATNQTRIVASPGIDPAQLHHLLLGAARATYQPDEPDAHATTLLLAVRTFADAQRLAALPDPTDT